MQRPAIQAEPLQTGPERHRDRVEDRYCQLGLEAGSKPGMQQLADSLILSGDGKNVALSFSVPSEVLDVLEGLAKSRKAMGAAAH